MTSVMHAPVCRSCTCELGAFYRLSSSRLYPLAITSVKIPASQRRLAHNFLEILIYTRRPACVRCDVQRAIRSCQRAIDGEPVFFKASGDNETRPGSVADPARQPVRTEIGFSVRRSDDKAMMARSSLPEYKPTEIEFRFIERGSYKLHPERWKNPPTTTFTQPIRSRRLRFIALFHYEIDAIARLQLGSMILGDNSNFQTMTPRRDPGKRSRLGREHAHQVTVDIRVHMMALPPFNDSEADRNSIALQYLTLFRREYFNARSVGRSER